MENIIGAISLNERALSRLRRTTEIVAIETAADGKPVEFEIPEFSCMSHSQCHLIATLRLSMMSLWISTLIERTV
jgi:hypothetical protein